MFIEKLTLQQTTTLIANEEKLGAEKVRPLRPTTQHSELLGYNLSTTLLSSVICLSVCHVCLSVCLSVCSSLLSVCLSKFANLFHVVSVLQMLFQRPRLVSLRLRHVMVWMLHRIRRHLMRCSLVSLTMRRNSDC